VYPKELKVGLVVSRLKIAMWDDLKTLSEDLVYYLQLEEILVVSLEVEGDAQLSQLH
jgi:hypothetical protein